jgi:excisionase family DNA binding protein
MKLSDYYTVEQVADYFGLSRTTIIDAIRRGYMVVHFFESKKIVIHKSQIENMRARWKPCKKEISRPPLKSGLYYTPSQVAITLGLSEHIIREAICLNLIRTDFLGKHKSIIHEDEVNRFRKYRKTSTAQAKREAQQQLLKFGFKYSRNPPSGAPRGSSRNPSPFRRGWSNNGVYYGLTAVEALREWRKPRPG